MAVLDGATPGLGHAGNPAQPADDRGTSTHRALCPGCGRIVILAELPGGPTILLELAGVVQRMRCPTCLSVRFRDPVELCWRCGAEPFEEAGSRAAFAPSTSR